MDAQQAADLAIETLENGKARDIQILEVGDISDFTDKMIIATGTSSTHVRALGSMVEQAYKDAGHPCIGAEAGPQPEWFLIDHGDVIIHVMTEQARAYYAIEKLWQV